MNSIKLNNHNSSSDETLTKRRDMIRQYADQPSSLPRDVLIKLNTLWSGERVQLYAMSDLNRERKFSKSWWILGESHLAIISTDKSQRESVRQIELSEVDEVREDSFLSCNHLSLMSGGFLIAECFYTHRQRRAMGNLIFALEKLQQGKGVENPDADRIYAEAMSHDVREAQSSVKVHRLSVVLRLLGYLLPYRKQLIVGAIGAFCMTFVHLAPAYLTGRLIDAIVKPYQTGKLSLEAASLAGWTLIGGIALLYVLGEFFMWIRLRWMSKLGEYVAHDLRRDLYAHLTKLGLDFFTKHPTGSIISRVSSDTDRLWDFVAFGVVEVSISVLMLIGLGGVLIWLDPLLGTLMTLPVPIFLWMIARHGAVMQNHFLRAWNKWSQLTAVLSDTVPGFKVVKAFSRERHEQQRFGRRNHEALTEFNAIHDEWTSFWPLLMLSIKAVMLLVWVMAFPRLIGLWEGGQASLSAGVFVSFLLYMTQFTHPIEVIGQLARMLNRATSSAYRVFEVLDTEPKVVDAQAALELKPVRGEVSFDKVSFSYDGLRQVLRDVSFEVKPGELIGLVGPSGGGKSTITNLIARFYDVTSGRVLIDGHDIRELDSAKLRRQYGIVLQDPYLFHGSVLDNIRYGFPEAGLDRVVDAARAANAHEFIGKLPQAYDTIVGERGQTLSGGERQRISIARAILHNPRILILDEATSSVDTESEKKIQEALDRLVEGRTVFAIAHRLSTLAKADRLFVIENGQLVETGTHEELLSREAGVYRKLHEMQNQGNGG